VEREEGPKLAAAVMIVGANMHAGFKKPCAPHHNPPPPIMGLAIAGVWRAEAGSHGEQGANASLVRWGNFRLPR